MMIVDNRSAGAMLKGDKMNRLQDRNDVAPLYRDLLVASKGVGKGYRVTACTGYGSVALQNFGYRGIGGEWQDMSVLELENLMKGTDNRINFCAV